jgi:hypothetical protein
MGKECEMCLKFAGIHCKEVDGVRTVYQTPNKLVGTTTVKIEDCKLIENSEKGLSLDKP